MQNIKGELVKFIKAERWNFSPSNYATMSDYQKDRRVMEKDRQKCFELLAEIDEIKEDKAQEILRGGRLEYGNGQFSYTPGQLYDIEVLGAVRYFLERYQKENEEKQTKLVELIDWNKFTDVLVELEKNRDQTINRHATGLLKALKL